MMRTSPPIATLGVVGQPQLLSARTGCRVFRPQDGGLLDLAALCLR
jgi:hypothetical protein